MVVVVALLAAMLGAPGAQATPLVPAAPPPTGQWLAEYYNNTTLTGAPVTSVLEPLGLPKQLDHNWGSGSPAAGVSADNFSARYSTTADFGDGGLVVFTSKSDDGVRVKVDGTWVINNWTDHSATVNSGVVPVTAGSHTVVVEYYERGYSAVVQLQWAPLSPDQWYAEYFNNTTLTGTPVRAGLEPRQYLLHDWGYGAPPGVNADNFSARFTTTFQCCDGWALHFTSYSDDGIRVKFDGSLVINNWTDHAKTANYGGVYGAALVPGSHTLVVEYYEHSFTASCQVYWAWEYM